MQAAVALGLVGEEAAQELVNRGGERAAFLRTVVEH
jgi:hypothetical protein